MKILFAFISCFHLILSKVVNVEPSNYEDFMENNDPILFLYYADTKVGRRLQNEFAILSKQLEASDMKVTLGQMLLNNEKSIVKAYKISGIPSIYLFSGKTKKNYGGSLFSQNMFDWLALIFKRQHRKAYKEINNLDDKLAFINHNEGWVVYFGDIKDKEFALFEKVSKKFSYLNLGHTSNKTLFSEFKPPNSKRSLLVYHPQEQGLFYYGIKDEREWDEKGLINFIKAYSFHNMFELDIPKLDVHRTRKESLMILIYKKNVSETEFNIYRKSRLRMKGRVIQAHMNAFADDTKKFMDVLGLNHIDLPTILIVNHTTLPPKRFIMSKSRYNFTENDILSFYEDFTKGFMIPVWKSEPNPEENYEIVKKVVGNNFEDIVKDSTKDVFMLFYNFNEKSEKFLPEFKKIAESYSDIGNMVFGQMNVELNEADGLNLVMSRLPLMALYKKNSKFPNFVEKADRTVIDLFLENNIDGLKKKSKRRTEL